MGLLSDTLRHLLATDPAQRRAGLAGIAGRLLGIEPVFVTHPSVPPERDFDVVHFPKSGAGLAPRSFALTATIGLAERQGRELVALTLADVRDPEQDRIAWMLAAAAETAAARGAVVPLPEGCLGRSSHASVLIADPWPLPERARPDYEQIFGGRLDLCVPVTPREAVFVAHHGAERLCGIMQAQHVAPYADRPAGQTELPGG